MKLQFRDIEPFVKRIDQDMRAILVYGPDAGLVQERAAAMGKQVVADLNDPFNAAHLTGDIIAADESRLADEATAQSLMGGKRLVRITGAGNEIAVALKAYLKGTPNPACIIIIEAGDLKPKDALRKVAEDQANAAAIPCYIEDERALSGMIKDQLREAGYNIQSDAANWLAAAIKGDRMRARMEVDKLLTYMGYGVPFAAANMQQKNITLEDVRNSCGDAGMQSIDDLVYSFMDGKAQQTLHSFERLAAEATPDIVMLRALQNHILRLHATKSLMELHDHPLDLAMKSLQPEVFWKVKDQFIAQVKKYSLPELREFLFKLNDLEAKTKQTGMPVDTLMGHFLLKPAA